MQIQALDILLREFELLWFINLFSREMENGKLKANIFSATQQTECTKNCEFEIAFIIRMISQVSTYFGMHSIQCFGFW